ncbi:hypothetical protein ERX35_006955 [Macrococcus equipercicus]|uniref:Uncharacterized protein n=1 Tax=Macrococcus equipercicus TaxID=69967 RepID=A0ABQ6R863_9STAP|nr:hypothetical protein [Macrococcus equipercicus]KAA1039304.1 hypothetical protein ERX35_006955 [Macrococcus equipercicus]
MEKSIKSILFIAILFITYIFILNTTLYYLSIAIGYHGLAIPLLGGGDDGEFYYNNALILKNGGNAIITSVHVSVLGYLLKLLNTDYIFVLKMWNIIGAIIYTLVSYFLISILVNKKLIFYVYTLLLLLTSVYISFIYNISISLLRDIWIIDFYLLSIVLLILFLKSKNFIKLLYLVPLTLSIVLLMNYRDYAAASFIIASIIFIIFNRKNHNANPLWIISSLIIAIGIYYTFLRNLALPIVGLSMYDALEYRQMGTEMFGGGSQMNISLNQSNYILFLGNYIYSLISNAIGPLPVQIRSFSSLVLFLLESLPIIGMLIYLWYKRVDLVYEDRLLLVQSLVWFMFIGVTNDNMGTAARLRIPGYIFIFIIFAKTFSTYYWGREKHSIKQKINL